MISIIEKIKALLYFKGKKEKVKTEYTDLAPIDEITNGNEYLNALSWGVNNERIKNIALAGPYGAGKSSIIETYLKRHPQVEKKSLRISMATFVENAVKEDGTPQKINLRQDEIELGILKQLFYKVHYKKIPQSRYRKLHKIGWKHIWGCLIGIMILISMMEYIFFPEVFNFIINKIVTAGASIKLASVTSLILFGIVSLGILAVISVMYRSILSHFKVKEIKLPVDAIVENEGDSKESVFNKNMDEIIYFFEETKYRLVFFEDLDRLENSSIFVHLRELNTLLNNYDVIKEPIKFVYAIRDDIFSDTDRTKFFDFIVPVIPIINSTNSGEILLEKLDNSIEMGIAHDISQNFVLDVSPYIADMRILQNIYNEFVVYKKTLRLGQDLNLTDEPMMALIIFKNLYPRDFADIQIERGIIKQAFIGKQNCLKTIQTTIQDEIDKSTQVLNRISLETLKNIRELKSVLLCKITGWKGIARQINLDGMGAIYSRDVITNGYDMSGWRNSNNCSGNYYDWNGSGGYSFSCNNFSEIREEYFEREKAINLTQEGRIAEEQEKVEQQKLKIQSLSSWSLSQLIEQFGIEEVLPEEIRVNKFLVFLLRRGYIDEKYANYINYFKGNSITKDDMNFILAVKNMEPVSFNYILTKTPMIVQKLQVYEFQQKAIYNFNLLECLLSSNAYKEKLNSFIKQLADEDGRSWKFIDEFVDITTHQGYFVKLLATAWHNMWGWVVKNTVLTHERKIHYLSLMISNADIDVITAMNKNNEMSDFFVQNEDILQQLAFIDNCKVIAVIRTLPVIFSKIFIENVSEDVLNYIFNNNCYELNSFMIRQIVRYKNKDLVHDLNTKNYTTIIKLGYTSLTGYVRENISYYVENIVLAEEHSFDTEEQIVDLLERSINDSEHCTRIIECEKFCMEDITYCCSKLIVEKKIAVNVIWNNLLKYNKVLPTWENMYSYWSVFKFTHDLVAYIESHTKELLSAANQCIDDDFIKGLIGSEIADGSFEDLISCVRMKSFNLVLDSIVESKVAIMVRCKYFDFTTERYKEIKESFPELCVEFILQNQEKYISINYDIQMGSNLLENLLLSNRLRTEIAQTLLDIYGKDYMTNRIAINMRTMRLHISLEIFHAAWKCLDESGKQELMLEYLELLDATTMYSCFNELKRWYLCFLDRSKQHVVELVNIPENQKLAERLKSVGYITSYQLKEKKKYDSVTEAERVITVIICRVKAIK